MMSKKYAMKKLFNFTIFQPFKIDTTRKKIYGDIYNKSL